MRKTSNVVGGIGARKRRGEREAEGVARLAGGRGCHRPRGRRVVRAAFLVVLGDSYAAVRDHRRGVRRYRTVETLNEARGDPYRRAR
jgi:hypothetical protein